MSSGSSPAWGSGDEVIGADRIDAAFRDRMARRPWGRSFAPGRVNLIGEHIDYHGASVLPMALDLGVSVAWAPRDDGRIHAWSGHERLPPVDFEATDPSPATPGAGWINHLRAATRWVSDRVVPAEIGADLVVEADVPIASGLSSSSALIIAVGLALLDRAGACSDLDERSRLNFAAEFARAERFVGTEGGGMDQAASLCGVAGHALLIDFDPLAVQPLLLPPDLAVIVAHSGVVADKSGAALDRYNAIRNALDSPDVQEHLRTERERVASTAAALRTGDLAPLGPILDASHASLNERLQVGHPALDRLVEVARQAGALGARMTGAGFGGSIVTLARSDGADAVLAALQAVQAAELPAAVPAFQAEAGAGAKVERISPEAAGPTP